MPNRNYQRGVRFERDVMKVLTLKGFKVIRASGSHGEYDVVAYKPEDKPLFVQCKVVAKVVDGERLINSFKESTTPSKYYHQALYVKAGRGMVSLLEVTL